MIILDRISLILMFVVFLSVLWIDDFDLFTSSRIIYPQAMVPEQNMTDDCSWKNIPIRAYTPITETQSVVIKVKDTFLPLERVENCTVASKDDWWCEDFRGRFGFDDGQYFSAFDENHRRVNKVVWLIEKLKNDVHIYDTGELELSYGKESC